MRLVYNLRTGEQRYYSSTLSPRDAVVASYAQSLGDSNTWTYKKYHRKVKTGKHCVTCGDWTTLKGLLVSLETS